MDIGYRVVSNQALSHNNDGWQSGSPGLPPRGLRDLKISTELALCVLVR